MGGQQTCIMETRPTDNSSPGPYVPIGSVINENWRGKNDPAERRRIQNRLNQRAFRQRQRTGESTKQYKPRSASGEPPSQSGSGPQTPVQEARPLLSQHGRAYSAPAGNQPGGLIDSSSGRVWDELGQLINRNLMASASSNAQYLNIDQQAVSSGTPIRTARPSDGVPAALQPVRLQLEVPHDPIFDIIPHPRFRFNILKAIATQQADGRALSNCIRASGALENVQGQWQRGGVVVWSSPEQLSSWELSESFVGRWGFLLEGCAELLAATNAWRTRRGERPLYSPAERDA